jgi:hypothetical protein
MREAVCGSAENMSLGIVIKGPEGIVLAAESRVTLTAPTPTGPLHVNFDNATKVLAFHRPNTSVGAVTYGAASIGIRTPHGFIPEFEAGLSPDVRLPVDEFAQRLSDFFLGQWNAVMPTPYTGPDICFVVGGFDAGQPYGRVFDFYIPNRPLIVEQNSTGSGLVWGGQREMVDRLIQGFDSSLLGLLQSTLSLDATQMATVTQALRQLNMPLPIDAMALQDYIDLATFFIRTTIAGQKLTVGIRGCGGPIDVAIITRNAGFQFIHKKGPKLKSETDDQYA